MIIFLYLKICYDRVNKGVKLMEFVFEKIVSDFDGTSLEVMSMVPEHPKAILQMNHGMAENKERYQGFMRKMADEGYICVMHDHRGHGSIDEQNFGYFKDDTGKAIVDDAIQVTRMFKERYQLPIILFGHSMGSLVVRCVMKKADDLYHALIVCGSPSANPLASVAITLAKAMAKIKGEKSRSHLLDNLALGAYTKAFPDSFSKNGWICSDESIVKAYDEDKRCGFSFTINGYINLFILMKETYDKNHWQMKNKDIPIYFIAGTLDPCIENIDKFNQAVDFMKQLGYKDVESQLFENVRHEILNDVSKEEVTHQILEFIKNRCTL